MLVGRCHLRVHSFSCRVFSLVSSPGLIIMFAPFFQHVVSLLLPPRPLPFLPPHRYSATASASSSSSQHYGQSVATPGPQRGNPLISPMTGNAAQGRDRHFFPADETLPQVPEGALGMCVSILAAFEWNGLACVLKDVLYLFCVSPCLDICSRLCCTVGFGWFFILVRLLDS